MNHYGYGSDSSGSNTLQQHQQAAMAQQAPAAAAQPLNFATNAFAQNAAAAAAAIPPGKCSYMYNVHEILGQQYSALITSKL